MGTKIQEQKLKKNQATKFRNENFKIPETKITKIREQKSRNKNFKNPRIKVKKIREQKISKIWEQILQKYRN
jgi:hypothetical protein